MYNHLLVLITNVLPETYCLSYEIVSDLCVPLSLGVSMWERKGGHAKRKWRECMKLSSRNRMDGLRGIEGGSCHNNIPFESARLLSPSSGVTFNSGGIHWWSNSPYTVYTHRLKHARSFTLTLSLPPSLSHTQTQANCQLLTRQIGTVVYSMAPLHFPTGPSQFIWKWLDEGKQHVTAIGLPTSFNQSSCCLVFFHKF